MAKRRNKAAKIREALAEMGTDAPAKEVVVALSKQRVKVTPQQVYMVRRRWERSPSKGKSPYEALLAVSS